MRSFSNRKISGGRNLGIRTAQRVIVLVLALSSLVMLGFTFTGGNYLGSTLMYGGSLKDRSVAVRIASVDVRTLTPSAMTTPETGRSVGPTGLLVKTTSSARSSNTFSGQAPSSVSVLDGAFDGLNSPENIFLRDRCGACFPPDPQLAAGPTALVQMVNTEGAVFSKRGETLKIFTLAAFFANNGAFSDPKVLYDSSSSRWFASIIANPTGTQNFVLLAVSTSTDPLGTWNIYQTNIMYIFPDQPLLGVSDDKVVVSANDFLGSVGGFIGAQYWILNKSQLVNGLAQIDLISIGPDPNLVSAFPVQSLTSTSIQYLVSTGGEVQVNSTSATLISISGTPPGTVSISSKSIPFSSLSPLTQPPKGLQPGTTSQIETNDIRVLSAVFYQGKIWYAANDGCTPPGDGTNVRSCARITEIDTSTSSLVQDFDYGAAGFYYFYPSLSVDNLGDLIIVFGYSSNSSPICCYPSLGVTGRATSDPINTLASFQLVKAGSAADTTGTLSCIGRPVCARYGDYFGSEVDPVNASMVWITGEYHNSALGTCPVGSSAPHCWSTYIAAATGQSGFAISSSITYLNPPSGSSTSSTLSVSSLAGFSGSVSLATSVSRSGPTASLGQSSVSVPPSPGTTTLTVNVPSNIPAGSTFTVTVTGTSGTVSHSTTVTVTVGGTPSFSLTASSSLLSATGGSFASAGLILSSSSGFNGTVNFSATSTPPGQSFTFFYNTTVLKPQWSTANSIIIATSAPTGTYSIAVTATSGTLSQTVSIMIAVTPMSFNLQSDMTFSGVRVVSGGILSIDSSLQTGPLTYSGTATVTVTNATTGSTLFATSYYIQKAAFSSTPQGTFQTLLVLNVSVAPYPLSDNVRITISAPTSTSPGFGSVSLDLTRNPDVFEQGIVTINDVSAIVAHYGCIVGTSGCDPRFDLDADGTVDINDVGIVEAFYGAFNYNQYNFLVSSTPSPISLGQGSSQPSTVSLSGAGFAGSSSLSTVSPAGITATLSPTSLTGAGSSTLTIVASQTIPPGSYSVSISGTTGSTTHTTTLPITVTSPSPDFTISLNPLDVPVGKSSSGTVSLTSTGGFAGNVALSLSSSFAGLTVSLSSSTVTLTAGGSTTVTLTATSSTEGIYSVSLTGTSGSLSHSIRPTVRVGDFLITGPATISLGVGKSTTFSVAYYSIHIGATVSTSNSICCRSGLTLTEQLPTTVTVQPDGPGASPGLFTLTASATGTFTVKVTGTSSGVSHSLSISVQVCVSSCQQ